MTGKELKATIKNKELYVNDVAKGLGISRQAMYLWFAVDKLPKYKADAAMRVIKQLERR